METIKIAHKDGYAIINKDDFDAKKHKLFDEAPTPKKPAKKAAPKKKASK
jgi:hypothetical protein